MAELAPCVAGEWRTRRVFHPLNQRVICFCPTTKKGDKMPRNMSFMLTTKQIENRTKTVTRRLNWRFLREGDIVNACEKCMGLKKGEKIRRLCQIRIKSIGIHTLWKIDEEDVIKEGFPNMTTDEFVGMFCREMKCSPDTMVTRIEFEYV